MKRIISILCLMLALPLGAQQIITATVTVTNAAGTTNGNAISINGLSRTFTNTITTANNQILTGTNITLATSNLFLAYVQFPVANVLLSNPATNIVRLQSYPGGAMTVALTGTWGTLTYATQTVTAATVFRAPFSIAGPYERTNVEVALVAYLSDTAVGTNAIPTNAPAMKNFLPPDQTWLSNYVWQVSTNATNFTRTTGLNLTNYVGIVSNFLGTWIASLPIGGSYQPACAALSNLCDIGTLQGFSYIEAGTGNILLSNTNGVERLRADENGYLSMNFENGTPFFTADTSHNFYLQNYSGVHILEYNADYSTVLRSALSFDALTIDSTTDTIKTYAPMSVNQRVWPATVGGTVTNFLADALNSGTADTSTNSFQVPANALSTNGDYIIRTIGVKLPNNAHTRRVYVTFAGSTVFDTGAQSMSADGALSVTCEITRDGTTSFRFSSFGSATGMGTLAFSKVDKATGVDFTAANSFVVHLVAGVGGTNGDLDIITDTTRYYPGTAWSQ